VTEQRSEDRTIPYTLQGVLGRGPQKTPNLRIAVRRRTPLVSGALDAVHRIAEDRIELTKIIEERR
jgi:hypothetical protein